MPDKLLIIISFYKNKTSAEYIRRGFILYPAELRLV